MMQNRFALPLAICFALLCLAQSAFAQQPANNQGNEASQSKPGLKVTTSDSQYQATEAQPKPMTFRQYRAQVEMQNRMARIEYHRWIGYDTLRPTVSASPYYSLSTPPYVSPYIYRYYQTPLGVAVFRY
ncbi:MAG: hypothetical protein JNK90_02605 [Planctomycetaceae bacterium]|nr:hypothetical protein [Planctomycetaceae bacterium]